LFCPTYEGTPLHDTFWTADPQFELIKLLVLVDPSLLLMKDKRDHCPLHYVREEHEGSINQFYTDNQDIMFPSQI